MRWIGRMGQYPDALCWRPEPGRRSSLQRNREVAHGGNIEREGLFWEHEGNRARRTRAMPWPWK